MAYNAGSGLPFEAASKLGHLSLVNSPWIQQLVTDFDTVLTEPSKSLLSNWNNYSSEGTALNNIWVVDGSFVPVKSGSYPSKEVAFIKTAILNLSSYQLGKIDKQYPHPMDLQKLMKDNALFHSTVLPLRNIKTSRGTNFDAVRHIIYESLLKDEKGAYFETLKWLSYENGSLFIKIHLISIVLTVNMNKVFLLIAITSTVKILCVIKSFFNRYDWISS